MLPLRLLGTDENVQKAIGLISKKKKTLHLNHVLCYISLPSLNDYDQKLPNFNFIFHGLTHFT